MSAIRVWNEYPVRTFQIPDEKQITTIEDVVKTSDQAHEEEEENFILCKHCKNRITSLKYKTYMNGKHHHVFANPAGIVFEIRCFSLTIGCVNQGQPTTEFTWFDGFSWRFSLCSNCHSHMGWFYQSKGKESFYGLIADNIIEGC